MACDFEPSTLLFSGNPGKVVALDGTGTPFAFSVDSDVLLFNKLKGIATSVGIQAQSGFQFMHALREFIYVYVFTERVGEIVVNGLVFPEYCDNLGPQDNSTSNCTINAETGLERLVQWYECNRITSRAQPIVIALGGVITYDTFLVSMKADIANAETGVAQFSLRFSVIPHITNSDDTCFPWDEDCLDPPCEEP